MKKHSLHISLLASLFFVLSACQDEVSVDLKDVEPVFTVDAWLDNMNETQQIILTRSTDYFNNETLPPGVVGAEVFITDEDGVRYDFTDQGNGIYEWNSPVSGQGFGEIGKSYNLSILSDGTTYSSSTLMKATTTVDTVYFVWQEDAFEDDFVRADFQARDLPSIGDTYWIKAYKNDTLLNRAGEINIAFDAGFTAGGGDDQNGKTFIPPLRFAINDFDELPIYEEGDRVRVEIHSISFEAFDFLNLVIFQSDREAGFGALFETPLANVSTNITSSNTDEIVTGLFNIADVQSSERTLVLDEVLPSGCFFDENVQVQCP